MHKSFFLAIFLLFGFNTIAQVNKSSLSTAFILKGSYLVGGSISPSFKAFSSDRTNANLNIDKGTVFGLLVDAKFGYFFAEDLAGGGKAQIEYVNFNSDSLDVGQDRTVLLYGPFFRAYTKSGIFGEVGAAVGINNTQGNVRARLRDYKAGIGYTHFLNDKISVEPILSFRYSKQKLKGGENVDNSQYGPELSIGFQAYLFRFDRILPRR